MGSIKTRNWNRHIRICVLVVSVCLALLITSCVGSIISAFIYGNPRKYHGDYPELYSIAINSIPGTLGYNPDGHGPFPAKVLFLEEDSLGRMMFYYGEQNYISRYNIFISQKRDGEYAYYYPDYNFISTTYIDIYNYTSTSTPSLLDEVLEKVGVEEIEKLKRRNDWNMNINIDKCEKVKIVRRKEEVHIDDDSKVREFYRKSLGSDADRREHIYFFTKDDYNRSMYVGFGRMESNRYFDEKNDGISRRVVILFFQPDGSYDEKNGVMELTNLNNYQDDLKAFKERNKWNVKP